MSQRIIIQPSSNATAVDIDLLITSSSISSSNQLPIANAGSDIFITAPSSSVELNGSASSDPDGSIVLYLWTKVSGPAVTISNSTNSIAQANGLVQGTYVFRLTVTDNNGATSNDTVSVTVNPPVDVEPPSSPALSGVASSNSINLTWTQAIDNVGIAGYDVYVNNVLRTTLNQLQTSYVVISLLPSTLYSIYVKAKDVNGNSTNSNILSITTTELPNQPPTVNAGIDQSFNLPANAATLNGTANDPDGQIVSYLWTKVSGGNAIITNPNNNITTITGLAQGSYTFRLTVTDNRGASVSDDVKVTVNSTPVQSAFEGFGSQATGGSGQQVVHVTTLNATGPGSLTAAWGSNRIIVFDVGGTITGFRIPGSGVSYLTIDGTTAPSPAITLNGGVGSSPILSFDGTGFHHIVVQNIRVRNAGDNTENDGDGINVVNGANNIVFDHVSTSLNSDGNLDITSGAHNVTVQYCIIGGGKASAYGGSMLIAYYPTKDISIHHNFFSPATPGSGVGERAPFVHSNGQSSTSNLMVDFRNNVIFNWERYGSGFGYNSSTQWINNFYKSNSNPSNAIDPQADPAGGNGSVFFTKGNVSANGSSFPSGNHTEWIIASPYNVTTQDANTAVSLVMNSAGCRPLDAIDQALINAFGAVTPSTGSNNPPSVNAGPDKSITSPANSVTLTGSASDSDGTIASTLWTKVSGPVAGTIVSPTSLVTQLTNLSTGSYVFNLKATDNSGSTGNDTVSVNVVPVTPPPTTGSYDGYTLVYASGYNTQNDLDPLDHGQLGNGSLSTTIFKTGPGSFKSVPADVSSGIRSEVQYEDAQTPLEGIVEYDVYYDNFFANSGHSLQWHPSTSGGSGTGLYHKNGQLQFVTVKSGQTGTNVGAPFSVPTKAWHHIKLTYKFGSSGYIKVELDGVERVNANVQMGDGSAPYLKVGVNMWVNQTSVVYYDNLQVYKKI